MIYCYRCPEHGEEQEVWRSVTEDNLAEGPACTVCGVAKRRDFRAERVGLAETSRNKGLFPYYDDNLSDTAEPVLVESQQHRRRLMKERHLYEHRASDDAMYRLRQRTRRFY